MGKLQLSLPTTKQSVTTPRSSFLAPLFSLLFPPFFYLLVALAFSWPLGLHLADRVILAGSGDVWQHLWNNWWMRFSLLDLHSQPYYTPLLFHPVGANLYFHALDPLDGYLSTPFQLLFGVAAAFNLVILFQITVAGWAAYLLAAYLTGNRRAALVAGLIYCCSPLMSRLLNLGQLELTSIEWLPLYGLCFIKSLRREARPWLWRGLSVFLLLLLSLNTWYYLLYAVMFSGLYLLYQLWQERVGWRKQWPGTLALAVGVLGVYGLLILPVLLPTLREAGSGGTRQPISTVIYNSATLKGLLTTGPSLLWGLFGSGENTEFRGNFLGYVALGLAFLGLLTNFKKGWFWAGLGLAFLVLALGPVLHLAFDPDWNAKTAVDGPTLPGRLLFELPFGNIARVPLRYTLVTTLTLAVLAAYGLDWLEKHSLLAGWRAGRWALPVLAGGLVLLEFLPGSRPLADTAIPAFYNTLAQEGNWNDFALLETPDGDNASIISQAMYYQTAHHHPIVGGYLSRKPDYPFREFPGVKELLNLGRPLIQRDIIEKASLQNTIGLLQYYKIRYVVYHAALLNNEDSHYNASDTLQTVFGPTARPYYQDTVNNIQVWRVADRLNDENIDASKVLTRLGGGWDDRQDGATGVERTVRQQARLALFNPSRQPLRLKLQVEVRAASNPVNLLSLLNSQSASEQPLTGTPTSLNLIVTLQPGLNDMIFKTDGPVVFSRFNFANP